MTKQKLTILLSKYLIYLGGGVSVILLILYSADCYKASVSGLLLWFNIVLPSLLPFLTIVKVLYKFGFAEYISRIFNPIMRFLFNEPGEAAAAFFAGILGGFPSGAVVACDMYNDQLLDKEEAERLLCFTNNSSPAFLSTAIATSMFAMPELSIVLIAGQFAGCIFTGIITGIISRINSRKLKKIQNCKRKMYLNKKKFYKKGSFGSFLTDSMCDAINILIKAGGFIIIFSVFVKLLDIIGISSLLYKVFVPLKGIANIDKELFYGLFAGFFEITGGVDSIISSENASLFQKISCVGFICGWSGLSVHMQVYSVVKNSGLNIKVYLAGKLLHSLSSGILTYALYIHRFPQNSITKAVMGISEGSYFSITLVLALFMLVIAGIIHIMRQRKKSYT